MNDKIQSRIKELLTKKKTEKLTDDEFKELKQLQRKIGKGKKDKSIPKEEPKPGDPGNDFAWWNKEADLTKDSANFKCNYIAGTEIAGTDLPYTIPGVLSINLQPVYGNSKSASDPVNIWARDLFLRMFQKYRGISSYTAADLGIALIAGVEIVKLIAVYERIYGVINRYSKLNINMPFAEVYGLGLNATVADTLRGRLSDFRYDLNLLLRKAQRLCVLRDMSVIADALSLFGYEYLDHASARSQIIIFNPAAFGVYSDTYLSSGGSITFTDLDVTTLFDFNADNMCKALSMALDALVGSDSIQKIYGDLTVWFGEDAMLQFAPVPSDYMVLPVFSDAILHKMHNMESVYSTTANCYFTSVVDASMSAADKAALEDDDYHIYQVNDQIVTSVSISDAASGTWQNAGNYDLRTTANPVVGIEKAHLLDTYRVDVDPEVVVEGVLFKFAGSDVYANGHFYALDTCAFYVPKHITLWTQANGQATGVPVWLVHGTNASAMAAGGLVACIDWAPLTAYINTGTIQNLYGDMDNVIPLYKNDLARLHRTIILSGLHTDVVVINK